MNDKQLIQRLANIIRNADSGITLRMKYEFYRGEIKNLLEELNAGKQTDILVIMQREDENRREAIARKEYRRKD